MSAPRAAFRTGLAALAKAAVLVVGVPLALGRLWLLAPQPANPVSLAAARSVSTWAHLAVLVAGILWALAALNLARQVRGALRHHEALDTGSWSARWAGAIAGLILLATAGTSLAVPGASHVRPAPVATASARQRTPGRPARLEQPRRQVRTTVTVERDECLADVAFRATGCVDDWPLLARLNLGRRQVDGARMLDPARLHAGWRLDLPSRVAASGPDGAAPPAGWSPATPTPDRRLSELALVGLGVITTCALARRVRNLRRASSSGRRSGERATTSSRPVGEARVALEPFADAPLIDWIDLANRLLWRIVRDQDAAPPEVRLVRAGPDGIEFLLSTPRPETPWPFLSRRGGRWWVLDPGVEPADFAPFPTDEGRFLPSLVPLGDDEHASYLLVVGRGRRLGVDGHDALVDRTLEAIVTSLRTVPWAEQLAVELVGIDPPPADEQCYQLSSSTPAALADLATEGAPAAEPRLADRWQREPFIVVGREANDPECERVLAGGRNGRRDRRRGAARHRAARPRARPRGPLALRHRAHGGHTHDRPVRAARRALRRRPPPGDGPAGPCRTRDRPGSPERRSARRAGRGAAAAARASHRRTRAAARRTGRRPRRRTRRLSRPPRRHGPRRIRR